MIAVIDIGSNSVRYMGAEGGKTLFKKLKTTRLGEGISAAGRLSNAAMERTSRAVADFTKEARGAGATQIFAFATAAVRSAQNGGEFVSRVKELCGLQVDVVSGEREARLGLYGAVGSRDGGMIDVGGASTEVSYMKGGALCGCTSLPYGAVRLFDICGNDRAKLKKAVKGLAPALKMITPCGTTYAIGGTATTLAALHHKMKVYNPLLTDGTRLMREEAEEDFERLVSLSPKERMELCAMDEKRAEIIAGGTLLLLSVMRALRLTEITVSERDNLEGYLIEKGLI